VMATPVISISSEESIPIVLADPMVAPEVGVVFVLSPARAFDLVDYSSSSDFDPPEDSSPPIPDFPLVSPFLYYNYSEADSKSEAWSSSPSGLSSHDTLEPSSEFPLSPVVAPHGIRRRSATLV
ncbi:hypothetical protein Tco_1179499, partial [Tanacetum coccineum]